MLVTTKIPLTTLVHGPLSRFGHGISSPAGGTGSRNRSTRNGSHSAARDGAPWAPIGSTPSTLLLETPTTIAVFDKYPKATYHVLVMPRLLPGMRDSDLDSLASLLRNSGARMVLDQLADAAAEVEEMVRDEMVKTTGVSWGVNMGFHAMPSMHHLHLHVISDDLHSPALKTKKHYNSFRPDLGFFISLREVRAWIDAGIGLDRAQTLPAKEALLRERLTCFKCGMPLANIPALKAHLEYEFAQEKGHLRR